MSEPKKTKPKPQGIAAAVVDTVKKTVNPRYTLYRREAEAMGDKVLTQEQWEARQK